MCRGTKKTFKKPFRNPKRPRHQNRNEKSIKNFFASNDEFEKDDYFKLRVVGERIADDKKQIFGRRSLCILRLSL